ncbi:hypothetical protein ACMSYW_000893 [Cronobacter dublinensis]
MTFTKEQLIAAVHGRIDFANMMLSDNPEPLKERMWSIELELARIALSALRERAEPVAWRNDEGPFAVTRFKSVAETWMAKGWKVTPLYTAPPAPVEPMQPLVIDAKGTLRFKENPIVRKLLDYSTDRGYGLNEMALEEFDAEDRMQLAQLIGYSLSGYGSLSYVSDESYERAASMAAHTNN